MTSRRERREAAGTIGALVAVVATALLAAELTMRPAPRDRIVLFAIFGGVGAMTMAGAIVLRRAARRARSIRTAVLAVALGAVTAAMLAVLASAATMFLSTHDLRLVLVALGLGVGLGTVAASSVTSGLTDDLAAIGELARAVASGRRDVRTGVQRPDEVGALAAAFDDMVDRLAAAEQDQRRIQAARREFLAAVSHDLRTPLTSLQSALELLRDAMAHDPERLVAVTESDVRLLTSLVGDLFLLATIESGGLVLQPERLDLAELADEAVEASVPTAAQRNITPLLQVQGRPLAEVDPKQIQRVLRNLLANAVRHSPDGGSVTVRVSSPGDLVEVEVLDEGPGFAADFLALAFDSFSRADESRRRSDGGTGLGLAIARGLVEAHGGTIRAHPGPGGRITFAVPARLPK